MDCVLNEGSKAFTLGISSRSGTTSTFTHAGLKNTDRQSHSTSLSATRKYDAFGNQLSSTGTWNTRFGYAGNFGYQGDDNIGLKLLGHRYYDSSTGRFLTWDPIKDGRNWYGYGGGDGNPISGVDSDGLHWVIIVKNGNHIHVGLVNENGVVIWVGGRPNGGKKGGNGDMTFAGGMAVNDIPRDGTGIIVDISEKEYRQGTRFVTDRWKAGRNGQHGYCATTNICTHFADDLLEAIGFESNYDGIGTTGNSGGAFFDSLKDRFNGRPTLGWNLRHSSIPRGRGDIH